MRKSSGHINLIILLAVLSSVAPMGIDTYIPSIPDIASTLNVGIEKIELSLSVFLIGFSIGQVFGGPISDNFGRKNSSIYGLLGFSIFSFLIIFSTNIYELWIYRFLEAFFGGIIVVNASAAVRDRFHGAEAAKIFSLIGTVRSLAPLIAPAIGSFIIHFYSWKAVFLFLTLYSLVVAFWVYKSLDESLNYTKQNIFQSFKLVLTHKEAMKIMITLGLTFSGFFILIAKSSFIFIEHFKISTDAFPLFFGFNFIILIAMTRVNIGLLKKTSPKELIIIAITVQIIVSFLFILLHENISLITTMLLMASFMSMMALIFGNSLAMALEYFPKNAGVASSVTGVLQFGLGAIFSSITLNFHNNSFLPIAISLTILSLSSYFLIKTVK